MGAVKRWSGQVSVHLLTILQLLDVKGGGDGTRVVHALSNWNYRGTGSGESINLVAKDVVDRSGLIASSTIEEAFNQAKTHTSEIPAKECSRVILAYGAAWDQSSDIITRIIAHTGHDSESNGKIVHIASNWSNNILGIRDGYDTSSRNQAASGSYTEQAVRARWTAQRVDSICAGTEYSERGSDGSSCASTISHQIQHHHLMLSNRLEGESHV